MVPQVVGAMNVMQAWQHEAASGDGERKPRPQLDEALRCPRCDSNKTKFCYYNNKKMSQPRYFCKACRRYWTQGGSLRNVPIGGGCCKNKRSSASLSSSSSSSSIGEQSQRHQHLVSADQPQDFPNVLPTLMSAGLELPRTHLPPSAQLCLVPAPPPDFNVEMMTSSFMDILRGEFLGHQGSGFYEPRSSGMETPLLIGFDVTMQHGIVSTLISGDGASAGGGPWPTTQVGPENQQDGESVPDATREK